MAKHAIVAFVAVGLLARSAHSWAAFNFGTEIAVMITLVGGNGFNDVLQPLGSPGNQTACAYYVDGCTTDGGGRCDLGTTLTVGWSSDGDSATSATTLTGYNGGVFYIDYDDVQGPYTGYYCWTGPCKGPNQNNDGTYGIPAGTAC